MSDLDDEKPEMKEMMNKMSRYNKNVKALMDLMSKATEKLDELLRCKSENMQINHDDDEKERVGKILEKKGVGRPVGNWDSKREQYLKMLNEDKIKQPKPQTLEFYKIVKVGDKYVFIDLCVSYNYFLYL